MGLTDRDQVVIDQRVDASVLEQPPGVLGGGDVALTVQSCECKCHIQSQPWPMLKWEVNLPISMLLKGRQIR
jgi:hypothetical protein